MSDKPDIVTRLRNYDACHDGDVDEAADEIERLREAMRFWSYCTWQGMMRECPERKNELNDLFKKMEISPFN